GRNARTNCGRIDRSAIAGQLRVALARPADRSAAVATWPATTVAAASAVAARTADAGVAILAAVGGATRPSRATAATDCSSSTGATGPAGPCPEPRSAGEVHGRSVRE